MKLKNGIEIISMSDVSRVARVRLRGPFGAGNIRPDEQLVEKLKDPAFVSQWTVQDKADNFNYSHVDDVIPKDGDYINVNFRAISKTVVPGHWIDWTKDNVLQDSVSLLIGQTVYANHDFFDVNGWLGSVAAAAWDDTGANSGGVPGINARYKIDALMNPRIARGLLMTPPAIHSTSMTVMFEFDYSHPDMAAENKYKFLNNLGEEVDGEIVRFIVTRIVEYWEASLVFQGADRLAKQYDEDGEDITGEDDDDFADESMSARTAEPPSNSNDEEKTMKLTQEQKAQLGIEFDGDDVPETMLLATAETLAGKLAKAVDSANIAELTKRAEAGDALVTEKRNEVVRLARLAELGAEDGELDEIVTAQIQSADADTLIKLEKYYGKRAADRFPADGRSSKEDPADVEAAGGVKLDAKETADDPAAGIL